MLNKKIISSVILVALLLSLSATVFASETSDSDQSYPTVDEIGAAIGPAPSTPEGFFEKEIEAQLYVQAKFSGDYAKAATYLQKNSKARNVVEMNATVRAVSNRLTNMTQKSQETGYWCGFATLESVIEESGTNITQMDIVKAIKKTSSASSTASLDWYSIDGTATSQFPSSVYLNSLNLGFTWAPFPIGNAGANPASASTLSAKIISTVDKGWGCMALGSSTANNKLHPNYPSATIGHWVGIDGYGSSGSTIWIVDPANADAITWTTKPPSYYSIASSTLATFVSTRGIIW